jgi:hypothetical protein
MKNHLCSGWDHTPTQLVFGELANLAWPIVIHYRSDLYHDAQWLKDNLQVGVPFYYGVRDTGTDIWLTGTLGHKSNLQQYRCELTLENATHYLTVEETN